MAPWRTSAPSCDNSPQWVRVRARGAVDAPLARHHALLQRFTHLFALPSHVHAALALHEVRSRYVEQLVGGGAETHWYSSLKLGSGNVGGAIPPWTSAQPMAPWSSWSRMWQ